MIVGAPKEIKPGEQRVALTPAGVRALTERGHDVLVEEGAAGQHPEGPVHGVTLGCPAPAVNHESVHTAVRSSGT